MLNVGTVKGQRRVGKDSHTHQASVVLTVGFVR
jgi:hypothetical protein